jgi:fatty acid desaturase
MAGVSSHWRYSHNYRHHVFTNVLGVDDDLGFGIMRVTRDEPWQRRHMLQPVRNLLLASIFEWGIALHGLHSEHDRALTVSEKASATKALIGKIRRQATKDYLFFPLLNRSRWRRALAANGLANILRNVWAYVVIFCGHFPDGAEKFTVAAVEQETKPEWYLRQMLGTANFGAGRVLAFASGHLCYQIEHHLFPELPSNRYAQIATRVRALCDKYDLPYTTGSLGRQFLLTQRTIHKLAIPDRFLTATCDDAPETASEWKFPAGQGPPVPRRLNGTRSGLRTALQKSSERARQRTARRR